MLEFVREGRGCNVKFLDADVQRPRRVRSLTAKHVVCFGPQESNFYENLGANTKKAHTHGPGAGRNLAAQGRGCLPNPRD